MQGFKLGPSTLKVDFWVHKLFKWSTVGSYPFVWPLDWTSGSINFMTWNFQLAPPLSFIVPCSVPWARKVVRASADKWHERKGRWHEAYGCRGALWRRGGAHVPWVISFLFFLPQICKIICCCPCLFCCSRKLASQSIPCCNFLASS